MSVATLLKQMPVRQKLAGKYLVGFFALILVLTLLSRAMDAYTLPVVTTAAVGSGGVAQQVKVQGTIEPLAQVAVSAPAGYLIESLLVQEGSRVEEGDVLAILSMKDLQEKLEDAKRELEIARLNAASGQLYAPSETTDPVEQAQLSLERAREDLKQMMEDSETAIGRVSRDLMDARGEQRNLRKREAEDEELDAVKKEIARLERELEDAQASSYKNEINARRAIEDAERAVEDAQASLRSTASREVVEQQQRAITGRIRQLEMQDKENAVEKLERLIADQGILTAPQSGLVTKLNTTSGSITGNEGMLLLSDQSQGSLFKGTVEDAEGEKLARGDVGSLAVSNTSVDAAITAIAPPSEKGDGYEVSVLLPEEALEPGLSATFTIEKKGEPYGQVVPLSALHSRGNSTTIGYVYVIREKNTTLGMQLVVEEVEVQILEKNSERAAIQGVFEQEDKVVSGSSRSLAHGDRVRIEEVA